jgi:hypothetical protein
VIPSDSCRHEVKETLDFGIDGKERICHEMLCSAVQDSHVVGRDVGDHKLVIAVGAEGMRRAGYNESTGALHDMPTPLCDFHFKCSTPGQHHLMVAVAVELRLTRVGSKFGARLGGSLIQMSL